MDKKIHVGSRNFNTAMAVITIIAVALGASIFDSYNKTVIDGLGHDTPIHIATQPVSTPVDVMKEIKPEK